MTVPAAMFSALLAEARFPLRPTTTSVTLKVELRSLVTPFESVAITLRSYEVLVS